MQDEVTSRFITRRMIYLHLSCFTQKKNYDKMKEKYY